MKYSMCYGAMQIKNALLFLLLLFGFFITKAQTGGSIDFKSKNFPGQEIAFEEAQQAYQKGDYYFLRGPVYFSQALQHYLKAQQFNPNNADLNYQIGLCYLNLQKDRLFALPYLERARSLSNEFGNDFLMALGNAYQYNLEFEKAIIVYNAIKELKAADGNPSKEMTSRADKHIEECKSGMELIKKPVRVRIDNLGPEVNSPFPDYSPVLPKNESKLIFTSRRDQSTGKMVDPEDSLFFEDIYVTYKIDNDWADAQNIGKPINTDEHDASINLSANGEKLLIYRTKNGGDIYESKLNGIQWSDPEPLQAINSKWYENHACYSADGKQLYFISNRKDSSGYGGKDIYIADISDNGSFTDVRNAGPMLNTPYDEDGVFCHPDGKSLYFSSKGHNSMGGYDIFKSTLEDGRWSSPVNVGFPINSPEDDVFFVLSEDGKRAFFASYREEGFGDKDIYQMSFLEDVEEMSSLQFTVTDTSQQHKLNAVIDIRSMHTGELLASRDALSGETIANLPVGITYEIIVKSPGFKPYSEIIEVPADAANQIIARNIILSRDLQTIIQGQIADRETRIPLPGEVEFQDMETREVVKTTFSSRNGQFEVHLPSGREYLAIAKSRSYGVSTDSLIIPSYKGDSVLNRSYDLSRINRKLMSTLKGKVYDAASGSPVTGKVQVTEYGGISMLVYNKPGKYDCIVFNGASLSIQVDAEGYLPYSAQLQIDTSLRKQEISFDIPMVRIEKGSKMVLKNIFFDFNKSTLRPASYKTLNSLLVTLTKNPNIDIEISGHTDNIGSNTYNQGLSENRAQVVKAYLIRNGIAASRLKATGRSFSQPISTNDTPEGRQLNRRTEIKILRVK
jgi:outer membrane protein OmpA-like peptidoglycan-associated protein/tetratricopeptide (TPR) repeat protein